MHLCNENQLDALSILSLFHQSTSTCFRHICSPSSGGVLYIYNNWYMLYIYSIPPDDGPQICPKHVEVDWQNKLRIDNASSWFLLYRRHNYVFFSISLLLSVSRPEYFLHNFTVEHSWMTPNKFCTTCCGDGCITQHIHLNNVRLFQVNLKYL